MSSGGAEKSDVSRPGGRAAAPNRAALQEYAGRGMWRIPCRTDLPKKTAQPQEMPFHSRARPRVARRRGMPPASIYPATPLPAHLGAAQAPHHARPCCRSCRPHSRACRRRRTFWVPSRPSRWVQILVRGPSYYAGVAAILDAFRKILGAAVRGIVHAVSCRMCGMCSGRTVSLEGALPRSRYRRAVSGRNGPERAGSAQCCQTVRGRLRMAPS